MHLNLSRNVKISEVLTPIALANNTDQNTDRMDMQGWDGVVFIIPVTDSVDTGVAAITGEQSEADADGAMAALSGAIATAISAANDDLNNQLLILDIYRPQERYVQCAVTSLTANIAFGTGIAIQYSGRKFPITQPAGTTLQHTFVVSPDES